jgi:hypothetical protein
MHFTRSLHFDAYPPLLASVIASRLLRVVRNKWTKDTITAAAAYSMIDVEPTIGK